MFMPKIPKVLGGWVLAEGVGEGDGSRGVEVGGVRDAEMSQSREPDISPPESLKSKISWSEDMAGPSECRW